MLLLIALSLVFSMYYYVDAFKSGLPPKPWAVVGLMLGPLALPMFGISKHVAWRKSVGFGNAQLSA
ncbi:hypothetical protein QTP81_05180 [Alteromonas sp. ASW11-36]|uniref:Uncharacterized protein n=1 Tax=Alteromonas arenosi TaxID=3055817 RepID=A0ABT7SUW9_9ALTE|nr:hypothetical protein [Alteromonas sp. ASW11-36]MDM7859986.1 hypothetical protein [Alteromonas sp. ASW11-36]